MSRPLSGARFEGVVRKAVEEYGMIRSGDRIAVGLSGGKDSACLAWALARLKQYVPYSFDLVAIHLQPGFPGDDPAVPDRLADYCGTLGIPFVPIPTRIGSIVLSGRDRSTPCSLCANLRRGILHTAALEQGCRTVALGHHRDDAVETLLLNLFYGGRLHCFSPVTDLDRRGIRVIRPLFLVREEEIVARVRDEGLPVLPSSCPVTGTTRRQAMKELVSNLCREDPHVRDRVFAALLRAGLQRKQAAGSDADGLGTDWF